MDDAQILDATALIQAYMDRTDCTQGDLMRRAKEAGYTLDRSTISNTINRRRSNPRNPRPPAPPVPSTQLAWAAAIEEDIFVVAVGFLVQSGLAPLGAVQKAREWVAQGLVSPTVINFDRLPPAGGVDYDTEDLVAMAAILEEEQGNGSRRDTSDDGPGDDSCVDGRRTALPAQRSLTPLTPLFSAADG